MGLKHVGANSVTSVTAYVILYSYIQVHKLVQIKSNFVLELILHNQTSYVRFSSVRGVIGKFRNSVLDVAADRSVGPATAAVQQPVSLQLYLRPVTIRFRFFTVRSLPFSQSQPTTTKLHF